LKAKKSYGQHFLNQPAIANQIAHSLSLKNDYKHILEVGPGTGNLTKHLIDLPFDLKVVEADKDMVFALASNYPQLMHSIIKKDFLKLELDTLFENQPFGLIGNFPYNISSQILFKMLDYKELIPEMVGMFQKEVAARVVAKPGSKTYGVISVLIQAYYDGEYLFDVDKSCFTPPPKVQSGVIRLIRKENLDLGCEHSLFRRIVKQTFSQRRKMLRNTLKAFIKDASLLTDEIYQKRPEQLSVEDFINLTKFVQKHID